LIASLCFGAIVPEASQPNFNHSKVYQPRQVLGQVIIGYGAPAVAGDIRYKLGGYMFDLTERRRAAESKRAHKGGQKPH